MGRWSTSGTLRHRISSTAMASSVTLLPLLFLCAQLATVHGQLKVFDLRASELHSSLLGTADGYVKVFCGPASIGTTSVRNNNANPWWEENFTYFRAQENEMLKLEVWDSDYGFDDLLGSCQRSIQNGTREHD